MVGHGDSKKVDEKAKTLVGDQMCMKNWKWDIRCWGDNKLKMQILFSHAALRTDWLTALIRNSYPEHSETFSYTNGKSDQ